MFLLSASVSTFFFNDTAPTEISTLSLHVALPILVPSLARTHRSSEPDPLWNVKLANCAGVTSIAWPAGCATPPTIEDHLAEFLVAYQSWYGAIVSPSRSVTLNRVFVLKLWVWVAA